MLPAESIARAWAAASVSLAGPPSPPDPAFPLPAKVVTIPEELTLRTRWFFESARYRSPPPSAATSVMSWKVASVAAVAAYHSHNPRRSLGNEGEIGISVSRDRLLFSMGERTGNIWMVELKQR